MENPREARHTFDLSRGKCVHWFLSSIGWQWNLGAEQLRGFSCGRAKRWRSCISFPVKVLTLIYGSYTLLGPATYGAASLPPCLQPGEGHHLHHPPRIPVSWQQRLAVLTEGPSTLEFASPLV